MSEYGCFLGDQDPFEMTMNLLNTSKEVMSLGSSQLLGAEEVKKYEDAMFQLENLRCQVVSLSMAVNKRELENEVMLPA